MIRRVISAGMVVLVCVAGGAHARAADEEREIVGKYECKGADANGTEYSGTAEIKKVKDAYALAWSLGRFGTFQGIGIRSGNVLSVSWVSGGTPRGLVFQSDKDSKTSGRSALVGENACPQQETLTPEKQQ